MATTSNLSSIIRFYADKQKSPFIDFKEFCSYIKKYAEHHVEEQAELVKYLGDPTSTVSAELAGLEEKHLAALIPNGNKKMIVSITNFSIKYANHYKEIQRNEAVPYPLESELPKRFPINVIERKQADLYITQALANQNIKSPLLNIIVFARDLPSIVLPSCVPIELLLETSQKKIIRICKKDEYHDYFLKKLRSTNPAKEITIKNFYGHFIDRPQANLMDVSDGDDYYLWNQLCYYMRQDFEKIQDRTAEDTSVLQAIQISEIYNTYLKQKFQTNKKREDALKELKSQLGKPPYFFSMNQILKFHDQNGKLLYGQYSEDDLKNTLQELSTDGKHNELPDLLVFKVSSGTRYYVYKKNALPLVIRLCNEAHDSIEANLVQKWYNALLNYDKLPEMNDAKRFEKCLEAQVETNSPVLYSLLNANFMTMLSLEKNDDISTVGFHPFVDGQLRPYSELLLLTSSNIMSKAKMDLPFVYSIPIVSWLLRLFHSKKSKKKSKAAQEEALQNPLEEKNEAPKKHLSKEEALAEQAKNLTSDFIPEGSTLDRELNYLQKQWNKMISKEANFALTEDVNSLIRDYTRRVVRTLSAQSFTKDRVENLAETLVKTPNMQKIGEEKALKEYVALYILRLVSNTN